MILTNAQLSKARQEFASDLNALLTDIRDKAMNQFEYNLSTNVPCERLPVGEAASQAVSHGVIASLSKRFNCEIEPAMSFAADLLDDVNEHQWAAKLRKAAERMMA